METFWTIALCFTVVFIVIIIVELKRAYVDDEYEEEERDINKNQTDNGKKD